MAADTGRDALMLEEDFPVTEEDKGDVAKLPFQSVIGSLYWLATISRPDIYFAVHRASKFQNRPSRKLWRWLTQIMRYLLGTKHIGLVYDRSKGGELFQAYADAAFATELGAKSRTAWLFYFQGCLVSWASENPKRVMTSSTEAECSALTQLCKEIAWHRKFQTELGMYNVTATRVFEDNQATISLAT